MVRDILLLSGMAAVWFSLVLLVLRGMKEDMRRRVPYVETEMPKTTAPITPRKNPYIRVVVTPPRKEVNWDVN
jgi:hypothetical protein